MNMLKKNLSLFEKYRPSIYNMLKAVELNNNYKKVLSKQTQNLPNLLHIPTGMLLYNSDNPLLQVTTLIKNKNIKVPQLTLFFGFGLGYELLTFLQNFATPDTTMIVVEPDLELFRKAIELVDFEDIIKDKRIHFILGSNIENLFLTLRKIIDQGNLKLYVKAINIIENDLVFTLHKKYFTNFMQTLREVVKEILLHYGNDPWDSLIGIENTFLNIKEIINYPGIKDLKENFKNKPGIVVATGPSLNKNIHQLKGLENKAVICAVDASVRVMKKHGLKPHLVTSLERVLATAKLFEGLTEEDVKDVYLAACPVIRPETYANFPGERIIVYRNFATFHWLEINKGILDIGPSAANMAFKVLEFLGCNPIILIGQDLAFGEDDTTHAKGSTYGEKEKQYYKPERILDVEGNYKPKVKTTDIWYRFLKFYEKDVAHFNGLVINATEGGAKIAGTKIMTFAEAINNYITEDINTLEIIKNNLKYPTKGEKEKNLEKIKSKTKEAIEYCEFVIAEFKKALEYCTIFENDIIKPFFEKKELDSQKEKEIFQTIENYLRIFSEKKFFLILMHYVQPYYIKTLIDIFGIRAAEKNQSISNFKVALQLKNMYAVMIELIKKILSLFINLKDELEKLSIK
ncbi:6-hydroxymethylpterin diphosphokinase MptE-like protein [Deferribacter abyssi]|uniref:motility associated factor glycosyltransferase family protein n=1 Tax=Deferribacter abyssi TaxID=213806 RepID=UPI003C20F346